MKAAFKLVTTTILAVALILALPSTASANDTSTVDYAEFTEVRIGYTSTQVAKIFDSAGVTEYVDYQQLVKKYRVAYGTKRLDVGVSYYRDGVVWRAAHKWVNWTWEANPAHNPATKAEFLAIKQGMTLAQVRAIIGSPGVRSADQTVQTSAYGPFPPITYKIWREYMWPDLGGIQGDVVVEFKQTNGVYLVSSKFGVIWG